MADAVLEGKEAGATIVTQEVIDEKAAGEAEAVGAETGEPLIFTPDEE